jgi:hypothetical protein
VGAHVPKSICSQCEDPPHGSLLAEKLKFHTNDAAIHDVFANIDDTSSISSSEESESDHDICDEMVIPSHLVDEAADLSQYYSANLALAQNRSCIPDKPIRVDAKTNTDDSLRLLGPSSGGLFDRISSIACDTRDHHFLINLTPQHVPFLVSGMEIAGRAKGQIFGRRGVGARPRGYVYALVVVSDMFGVWLWQHRGKGETPHRALRIPMHLSSATVECNGMVNDVGVYRRGPLQYC